MKNSIAILSAPAFLLPLTSGQGLGFSHEPASWHRSKLSVSFSDDDCITWSKPFVAASHAKKALSYPYTMERRPGIIWVITRYGARIQIEFPESAFCS